MPDVVIAFFALGLLAGLLKSDLKVPGSVYDILTILLMLSIGIKGGLALHSDQDSIHLGQLALIGALGLIIPILIYPVLSYLVKLTPANSASIAAHYGSVSAGTFAVAWALAETAGMPLAPETTLFLVILELPAIILMLALHQRRHAQAGGSMAAIWIEALTSRGVILLMGGLLLGWAYGPMGLAPIEGLVVDGFKAFLALFLLEMGLCTARVFQPLPWQHWRLMLFAALAPFPLAWFGLGLGWYLELPSGSILVLAALTASASYIAAPAAIRAAIKQADIGLAMLAALGITFPINVLLHIPILASWLG
ncbi:MAG: sodium-dependent bicarbonate transport family permease [Idiomarina sp.]